MFGLDMVRQERICQIHMSPKETVQFFSNSPVNIKCSKKRMMMDQRHDGGPKKKVG